MKQLIAAALCTTALAALPTTAHAQSCQSASKVTSDIWGEVDDFVKMYPCVSAVDCAVKKGSLMTDRLIKFWNTMSGNGWSRIGPRRLDFDKKLEGTIAGTGGRMFVSLPSSASPVTLTIRERDGKGKVSVVVCKVDAKNRRTKVATLWFNDNKKRKNNAKEKRTVKVKGVKGDIITVHFDGKSVSNKFSYTLTAKR